MPNNTVRAAAEGMPNADNIVFNRRRMLLGLAAATAAAATVPTEASTAPVENPELIDLAAGLPSIVDECLVAVRNQLEIEKKWAAKQPWAPDELTAPGYCLPYELPRQHGQSELMLLGGYLWRKGEEFPRRIVVTSSSVGWEIYQAKRQLRKAKKNANAADFLALEEGVARLRKLHATALEYETHFADLKAVAQAEHKTAWPVTQELFEKLEVHVAAIMDTEDWTIEGLIIKAQALSEWDRVTGSKPHGLAKVAFRHGQNWHGQIAATVLRHAKGGAA